MSFKIVQVKSGYQKRKAKNKLQLMKVFKRSEKKKLRYSIKTSSAVLASVTQNVNNFSENGK